MTDPTAPQEPTQPGEDGAPEAPAGCPAQALQESLGRELAARIASATRREIDLVRTGRRMQTYGEFVAGLSEPTACRALHATRDADPKAPPTPVWLEIALPVAYVLIDALLGGGEEVHVPDRPLTTLEQRLLRRVTGIAGDALAECWPGAPGLRFDTRSRRTTRPPLREDPLWILTYRVRVSGQSGALRVGIPVSLLPESTGAASAGAGPVELSVAADDVEVDREELARLEIGDIITTDTAADGEVIIRVAGIPKYRARLGRCEGRRAVTITGKVQIDP